MYLLKVGSKSVKDCVQFYYLWKKMCPDELKQLKVLRRKREQYELYHRRSKDLRGQPLKQPTVHQSQKSSHERSNRVSGPFGVLSSSFRLCDLLSFGLFNQFQFWPLRPVSVLASSTCFSFGLFDLPSAVDSAFQLRFHSKLPDALMVILCNNWINFDTVSLYGHYVLLPLAGTGSPFGTRLFKVQDESETCLFKDLRP